MQSRLSIDKAITMAEKLADTARIKTRHYFRQSLDIEQKQDDSPVTIVDKEIEATLREMIADTFPDHGIFGEEYGVINGGADHVWIIDPIDGTGSFICGIPLFGTLISLVSQKSPILGIIDMPILGERWLGVSERTTLKDDINCHVSSCAELSKARLISTTPDMFDIHEKLQYDRVSKQCQLRRFGGDCYSYALLASGSVDLIIESDLKPYDYMAHVPVVTGAGGVISDWQGNPLTLESGQQVIAAATQELHQQALESLNSNTGD